jgi:hypothetical protein
MIKCLRQEQGDCLALLRHIAYYILCVSCTKPPALCCPRPPGTDSIADVVERLRLELGDRLARAGPPAAPAAVAAALVAAVPGVGAAPPDALLTAYLYSVATAELCRVRCDVCSACSESLLVARQGACFEIFAERASGSVAGRAADLILLQRCNSAAVPRAVRPCCVPLDMHRHRAPKVIAAGACACHAGTQAC